MSISVVIPHLNQERHLVQCLESLEASDYEGRVPEIIVVDNGSKQIPTEICDRWLNVQLTTEKTPGPGPARNKGVGLASGSILAFIDADCIAHPRWLRTIVGAFEDSAINVVGGDVLVRFANPAGPRRHEAYEAIYSFRNDEHIAEGFSGTGNLAMRASVFHKVGPFAGIDVAEDRDWGLRAIDSGYRTNHLPGMIVLHPTRDTFQELTAKWERHIAHDYAEVSGLKAHGKWIAKALALGVSPVVELPTVLRSQRIAGSWHRVMAFAYLVRIRLFRSYRMLGLLRAGDKSQHSASWNRRS